MRNKLKQDIEFNIIQNKIFLIKEVCEDNELAYNRFIYLMNSSIKKIGIEINEALKKETWNNWDKTKLIG